MLPVVEMYLISFAELIVVVNSTSSWTTSERVSEYFSSGRMKQSVEGETNSNKILVEQMLWLRSGKKISMRKHRNMWLNSKATKLISDFVSYQRQIKFEMSHA